MAVKFSRKWTYLFAALLVTLPAVCAHAEHRTPNLAGLWEAKRDFGPELRGPLTIVQREGKWSAEIGGHSTDATLSGNNLDFEFSGDRGKFRGHLEHKNRTIDGYWIQPGGTMVGPHASPVTLSQISPGQWRGAVVPLEDTSTFYLVIKHNDDGSFGAFWRNPERNLGVFINIDHLKLRGSQIDLIGQRIGSTKEETLATGAYDAENEILSIYLPSRGGHYDFRRIDDDTASDFYPRGKNPAPYAYRPPLPRNDGWPVASLTDVGISQDKIGQFVQMLANLPDDSTHALNLHGVLLIRHGKLVLEEYFHGFSADQPHDLRSASKSMTAVLTGAAIYAHAPISLSTPVFKAMGDNSPDLDPRKRAMTVENLLTMTSGFYCDDTDSNAPGNEDVMQDQTADPDWYHYTMNVPMALNPGEKSIYCSANPNLLGGVLAKTTGVWQPDYFRDHVAKSLQLSRYYLPIMPNGETYMGGGMRLTLRDFAKFGQLLLNGGVWNGKRIVSADWAASSISAHYELRGQHYGYLWWVAEYPYKGRTVRAFFAGGNGGQMVMGFPELDLIFACNGGNYSDKVLFVTQREYVPNFILPAIEDGK